jgi:subtilase family serine protease
MRHNRWNRTHPRQIISESLESRRLLSALPNPSASPVDSAIPQGGSIPAGQASPPGFSPTQIKAAYGISSVSFNGNSGTGAGQTIAIVVSNDNPNFVDSTDPNFDNSDLHKFDVAMGLADPPSFIKIDENGGTNYPSPDYGWANEIALDVEWTHAIAPSANILLVEASSSNLSDLIGSAANEARNYPGVSVVTMSFAVSEFSGETGYDNYFTTPSNHTGVTFVAASGDNGDPGGYPAFSPNVVAVGATALNLSNGAYGSEVGHNTSGGGISQYETKPSYQYAITQSTTQRTSPDVAFDGNPNTGVSVYDSYNGGSSTPWYKIGGTSFSAPAWAGIVAIADQGRQTLALSSLDGATQTLPRLYEISSSDYHDILTGTTTGSISTSAHAGYDLVTGLGTPVANLLIPDLAGGNSVSGVVFTDSNGNGVQDGEETGAAGFTVYLDIYQNGMLVGADPTTTTGSDGAYTFSDLPGGTFDFKVSSLPGWTLTTAGTFSETLGFGSSATGSSFGFQPNGQPASLAFLQQPSATVINHDIAPPIEVEVLNAVGGVVSTDTSQISLSLFSGTGPITGTLTENAQAGIATFSDISIGALDTDVLRATRSGLTPVNSNAFTIALTPPAVATQIVFGQQPTSAIVGTAINPAISVYLEDNGGHIVSTDNSAVTLALAAGSTTNSPTGTLTVNAVNGIARFTDITFTSTGTAALTASDGSLPAVTSQTFTAKIVPTKLVFAQNPTSTNTGVVINPAIVVDVADYLGHPVAGDSSAVTLSVYGNTATLGGTTTVNAVNGVATFSNITVTTAGQYLLSASDASLSTGISSSFNVTVPGTVVPTLLHSTVAPNLIGGSTVRASVLASETPTVTTAGISSVVTQVFAYAADGSATLLGSAIHKVQLKAGKKFSVSVPVTKIPAGLVGTYTLKTVVTDPLGNFSASAASSPITIAAPVIKLSEVFTRLTLPASVVSGAKSAAVAVVKITNTGNIPSTGFTVGIYASTDGTTNGAVLIASLTRKNSIRPNSATSVSIPLKLIPAGLNGSYQIIAVVTDSNQTITSATSGKSVTIAPGFVSLSATLSATAPATVAPGRTVAVTLTLTNAGNLDATGSATLNLGVSSDKATELPDGTTLIRPVTIRANGKTVIRLHITVPSTLLAGTFYPFLSFTQGANSVTAIGSALTVL